jgi:hypothetical protein
MLYARHVARYAERGQSESRTDDDVWKAFRDAFESFSRAQNILRQAPDVKIVHESEADQFAARLAREMAEHGVST